MDTNKVRMIQAAVGVKEDGIMGNQTLDAIIDKLGLNPSYEKTPATAHIFIDPGHTSDFGREHPSQFTDVDWTKGNAKKIADNLGFTKTTNDSLEHILNVKIALAFKKHLEAKGVKTTYYDNPALSNNSEITQVYSRANTSGADMLVSIHNNAAGSTGWKSLACKASGTVGLYAKGSVKGHSMAAKMADAITSLRKKTGGPDNRADHTSTSTVAVLTKTRIPACLIEIGFYDNINDLLWMSEHIDEIGKAMASCV